MENVTQTTSEGNVNEIVLIDLSSIAHPIWHMSGSDPDPNKTSQQVIARVRALTAGFPRAAICCDGGRSFRRDIAESYKANRPAAEAPLHHQIDLAKEQLANEGFPVWTVNGFEADDLIASAVFAVQLGQPVDTPPILIVSADKDLLQLLGPGVRAKSVRDGSIVDAEGVGRRFGVLPSQMRDYLTLVGDSSDNVKGAPGIGEKNAAALLARFGSLDALYERLDERGGAAIGLKPAQSLTLREFKSSGAFETTRKLITLRTDVPLPIDEIFQPRVQREEPEPMLFADDEPEPQEPQAAPLGADVAQPGSQPAQITTQAAPSLALATRDHDSSVIVPVAVEWERALDPRNMRDAQVLAENMFKSHMFSAYGSPQAVLSTIMVGRELGVPAMSSLRTIHNIEGKHSLSAALMVAIVLKSGLADYFDPIEFDETKAVFETKRRGARNPVKLTHTIEMGRQAWPKTKSDWEQAFDKSGWGRNPTDMVVARAQSRLARMVYPDLLAGLYTPEELAEIALQKAA